ncbi:hypothetical protein F7734_47560 [Scytonema sp. UIC 10036]|uniref:hypothetical protein n=1 Tax=Scytonema sp. UIC 10036 TaxID=2304196 RepID=UPI0012DA2060|nr:hypothetical protein [Scytonema sp. UIC 10036]MUG99541.1 hypothetical protein [Scytonema sp. UIC 10036]
MNYTVGRGAMPCAPTDVYSILQGLREIVGWVEHKRNPTNADKCWVRFLKRQ